MFGAANCTPSRPVGALRLILERERVPGGLVVTERMGVRPARILTDSEILHGKSIFSGVGPPLISPIHVVDKLQNLWPAMRTSQELPNRVPHRRRHPARFRGRQHIAHNRSISDLFTGIRPLGRRVERRL